MLTAEPAPRMVMVPLSVSIRLLPDVPPFTLSSLASEVFARVVLRVMPVVALMLPLELMALAAVSETEPLVVRISPPF